MMSASFFGRTLRKGLKVSLESSDQEVREETQHSTGASFMSEDVEKDLEEVDRFYNSLFTEDPNPYLDTWAKRVIAELQEEIPDELLAEALEVTDITMKGNRLYLKIAGKPYGYEPVPGFPGGIRELYRKAVKIAKYSGGRLIQWLKKKDPATGKRLVAIEVAGAKGTPPVPADAFA